MSTVIDIIGQRLHYSRADATAIVAALSEDDRELIEIAARRRKAPATAAEISAVIMHARTRAANRLQDPQAKADALLAAQHEARRHYETIREEPLLKHVEPCLPDAPGGCRRCRSPLTGGLTPHRAPDTDRSPITDPDE